MDDHIAMYGNVVMRRTFCEECECISLVAKDGRKLCCDNKFEGDPVRIKRMTSPDAARTLPPLAERRAILRQQHNRCFWCERRFGQRVGKRTLSVQWDHVIPFSYQQDNRSRNFVGACQLCNQRKSSKMFGTIEEARVWLQSRATEDPPPQYGIAHTGFVDCLSSRSGATKNIANPIVGGRPGTTITPDKNATKPKAEPVWDVDRYGYGSDWD